MQREPDPGEVTSLLTRISGGDDVAMEELAALVYWNVRQLARAKMSRENSGHLLQPTALANEALMRLIRMERLELKNRQHLYATLATVMRNVLVDYARKRRGGVEVELKPTLPLETVAPETLLVVHEQLERLARIDAEAARVFELRWFGGMPVNEIAEQYGVSDKTIQRKFAFARTWLHRRLKESINGAA